MPGHVVHCFTFTDRKTAAAADTETATSSVRAEPKETEMKSVLKIEKGKKGG